MEKALGFNAQYCQETKQNGYALIHSSVTSPSLGFIQERLLVVDQTMALCSMAYLF